MPGFFSMKETSGGGGRFSILFSASVFFLFVGPVVNVFPSIYLNSTHLYAVAIFVAFFLLYAVKNGGVSRDLGVLSFFWLLAFSYFVLLAINGKDMAGLIDLGFVLFALITSFMMGIIASSIYGLKAPEFFFKFCYYSVLVWASVILISFFNLPFRELLDVIFFRDYSRGEHLVELRVPAFHPMGGDGASMNIALLAIISSGYLMYLEGLRKLAAAFLLITTMISTLLLARTGFLIGAPILLTLFLVYLRVGAITKLVVFLTLTTGLVLLYLFLSPHTDSLRSDAVADYGFEHPVARALITLDEFTSGGLHSTTAGTLVTKMLIFPENNAHLFFGSGSFSRYIESTYSGNGSDVGYIRILNGVGLVGSLMLYVLFVLPLVLLGQRLLGKVGGNEQSKMFKNFFFLFCCVTLFLFAGNFKVIYILTGYANLMFFSLFFVLSYWARRA